MANKLIRKFNSNIDAIFSAIEGSTDLRDNYKLYSKVFRFYKKEGVNFTGDAFTDYTILVNCIYDDLSGEVIY